MITDKIAQNGAVHLQCDARTLIVGVPGTLKVYRDQDTRQEPQNVPTLKAMNSIDINPAGDKVLVSGAEECCVHDIGLVVEGKGEASDLPPMISLQKNTFRIMDAIFTHDGSKALVGDLGAKLSLLDLNDDGKELNSIIVEGEIVGLSYNKQLDLIAITTADGSCFIYKVSIQSGQLEKVASLGSLLVDKRVILTDDLLPNDSDFSDDDEDDDDDEDSLISATTDSYNTAKATKINKKLLKFTASRCEWSSNGDLLAIPTKDKKIQIFKTDEWARPLKTLDGGVNGPKGYFTNISFSKDDSKIVSLSLDRKLIIWDVKSKNIIGKENLDYIGYRSIWTSNTSLAIGSTTSELSTIDPRSLNTILSNNTDLQEEGPTAGEEGLFGDEDDQGDDVNMDDEDDADLDNPQYQDYDGFVVDDDGSDKRSRISESTELTDSRTKRVRIDPNPVSSSSSTLVNYSTVSNMLKPYSSGSTPWHGNRRYLTICQTGVSYTVKNESSNKITVNFFDTSERRDYHFDDLNGFDLCSMDTNGCLFGTSGYQKRKQEFEAILTYKRNSIIGSETLWSRKIQLRANEFITSISVGETNSFVCTSSGVIRKYTNFGRLVDMWMSDPIISVMNNDKFIFTIVFKNGTFWFNIQDLNGEFIQQNGSLPLNEPIKNMFFSKDGNPCIIREEDNLMIILINWRNERSTPIWKPILDIQDGIRRKGRGNELKAWPLALNDDEFMFIPYRGSKYPIFPLLSPMVIDILIPCTYNQESKKKARVNNEEDHDDDDDEEDEEEEEEEDAEEQYLRYKTLLDSLLDGVNNGDVRDEQFEEKLNEYKINTQKALLLLFSNAIEEDSNDDAFSICQLMELGSLEFAQRIAERQNMVLLVDQIVRLREANEMI